jgi:predicted Zn-ribbon and HTH transcriptional regulator
VTVVGRCEHLDRTAPLPHPSPWDIADIFRLHGESYRQTHMVSAAQATVMDAIMACRTAQLGGHAEQCPQCGFERYAYNSCRNRHCPKCQTVTKANWVAARRVELLPPPMIFRQLLWRVTRRYTFIF